MNSLYLHDIGVPKGFACPDVGLENVAELLDGLWVLQHLDVLRGLVDDAIPHLVGQQHVALNQVLLGHLVCLCADHQAHCFVECVNLKQQSLFM